MRYGSLAGDLGNEILDHVDNDLDFTLLVDSQSEFHAIVDCIINNTVLQSDMDRRRYFMNPPSIGGNAVGDVIGASLEATTTWEESLFGWTVRLRSHECMDDAFVKEIEIHLGRLIINGSHAELQSDCTEPACINARHEFGNLQDHWIPAGRCKAFGATVPCPGSPLTFIARWGQYNRTSLALPAVGYERCSYHPGTDQILRKGITAGQMLRLREYAKDLHAAGMASFYEVWFEVDGTPRELPLPLPFSADHRLHTAGTVYTQLVPLFDPVALFLERFLNLAAVWLYDLVWPRQVLKVRSVEQDKQRQQDEMRFATMIGSCLPMSKNHQWAAQQLLAFRPFVRSAADVLLRTAENDSHLKILWRATPLQMCIAYFVDRMFRCEGASQLRRSPSSKLGTLCNAWVRGAAFRAANPGHGEESRKTQGMGDVFLGREDSAVYASAVLRLWALAAKMCRELGETDTYTMASWQIGGSSASLLFGRWYAAFERAAKRWMGTQGVLDIEFLKRVAFDAIKRLIFDSYRNLNRAEGCIYELPAPLKDAGYLLINVTAH